jgi:hypothetical protein
MGRARLINDHVMALSKVLLETVAPNYREEEHRDIFAEFFPSVQSGLRALRE